MRALPGTVILLAAFALAAAQPDAPPAGWPQWGGTGRDFKTASRGLAATWPSSGPREAWSRALGDGYSAIAESGGTLFTMYRPAKGFFRTMADKVWPSGSSPEVVIAIDAATGRTLWEHAYDAPDVAGMNMEYGPGPHATPLVMDGLVYAVGATAKLHALDTRTGRVVWSHDLQAEFGARTQGRGYSCSPIAYGDTVILTVGGQGKGQAVMAFDRRTGAVAWKAHDFHPGFSSPLLINVDGQDQLVVFHSDGIAGVDPRGGPLFWYHDHPTQYGLNISTPVWGDGNLLFMSSAYTGGSRVLHLAQANGRTTVREQWFTPKMRVHFGTAVRVGERVYGSSGDFGPAFVTAIDVRTGDVAWQERGFARANLVYADGKLILLDEDGTLALASLSSNGLQVHAKASVLTNKAWTVPTLVGTRLYLRHRATIKALELGAT
jgi:outer membrane protein assembly factor BamB